MLRKPKPQKQSRQRKKIWLPGDELVEAAERREEEWLARFAEALGGTWLKGTALPANIGNMLDRLAELDRTLQSQKSLKLRVAKMEEDRERFVAEVRAAGTEVGEPIGDEPEQCAIRLGDRLEAALRARDAKVGLSEDLQRLQDAREAMEAEEHKAPAPKKRGVACFWRLQLGGGRGARRTP